MFNSISWQSYWVTIALLTTGYYLVIYFLYYRSDLKVLKEPPSISFFPKGPNSATSLNSLPMENSGASQSSLLEEKTSVEFTVPQGATEEPLIYSCMDEVNAFFTEAKRTKWVKQELIYALRNLLKKYLSLKDSAYKESISNVLKTESQHNCSVHLSAEDIACVWLGS